MSSSSVSATASISSLVVLLSLLLHILGDLLDADILAQVIIVDVSLHLDQVDNALEGILLTDRQLDGHTRWHFRRSSSIMSTHAVEIGAHDVHLVDVAPCGEPCTRQPDAKRSQTAAQRRPLRTEPVTEPSRTRRERSTSTVKSTWPGVSMMLIRWRFFLKRAGSCWVSVWLQ